MEYLETELDKINRYYRFKLINIITTSPMYVIEPRQIPEFFSGIFLEASETGIWVLSVQNNKTEVKKDFYYHDKIIKIEEAGKVNLNSLDETQQETINKTVKKYEESRKKEIEEFNKEFSTPDVMDPNDQNQINNMLEEVQKMVLKERKEQQKNNHLEKRPRPE